VSPAPESAPVPVPAQIWPTASALGAVEELVLFSGPGAAEVQQLLRKLAWGVLRVEEGAEAALSDCLRTHWKEVGEAGEVRKPAGWPGLPAPP
jgi:hypothetical protein